MTTPTQTLGRPFAIAAFLLALSYGSIPAPAVVRADPPVNKSGQPKKLAANEDAARKKAAKALTKYADWCAKVGSFDEARAHYRLSAYLAADSAGGRKLLARIEAKADEPRDDYATDVEKKRIEMADAGEVLFGYVKEARKQDAEDYARETGAIWMQYFHDPAVLERDGWQWVESLKMLAPLADAQRFEAGELRFEGKWLSADELAAADKQHSDPKNPWQLNDGYHYLRSTQPLAATLPVFGHVVVFRAFLLSQLACEMELKRPGAMLPVLLGGTRDEYKALRGEIEKWLGQSLRRDGQELAEYVGHTIHPYCPVVMSFFGQDSAGASMEMSEEGVNLVVQHELAHQLLHEGRFWNSTKGSSAKTEYGEWLIEGIATVYEHYFWNGTQFQWKFVREIATTKDRKKAMYTRFARAVEDKASLPTFLQISRMNDADFEAEIIKHYACSCAMNYMLLNRCGGALRRKYMELSMLCHDRQCDQKSFEAAMKGEDLDKLDTQFRTFLDSIEFED